MTVNLRWASAPLCPGEYAELAADLEASRAKLGFRLLGYVLMPEYWHALSWRGYPLTISRAGQDFKRLSARALNGERGSSGAVWQHQFWDRFVRQGNEHTDRLMYMHMNPVRKGVGGRAGAMAVVELQ